jgi:integrase
MHVAKHIVPRLGGISLLGIGAAQLNAFYSDLLVAGRRDGRGGLSPTTVHLIHATVHKALADGVRWGRLARNPADQSDPPRPAKSEMSVWRPDQVRTFIESVRGDRLFAAWLLAATTGMRRGELLGLRWSDLELDSGVAVIRQIRTIARYEVITAGPKTDKGSRQVALDQATVAALRAHRVGQLEERLVVGSTYEESGLVFTQPDGSAIHPERFSRWFQQRCRGSGLPRVRLHDVRHSYVTALIAAGVPLKVVSQRVGHASPMVTMSIYQHVLPGDDRAAAEVGARAILGNP